MKAWHWILVVVALAGTGFAVWWFKFRKPKPKATTYATPMLPTAPNAAPMTQPTAPARLQNVGSMLQSKAVAAVNAGLSKVTDKAVNALEDKLLSLF